jgi:GTP-binding protein HflX
LLRTVGENLRAGSHLRRITLPASDGAAIAWLHQHGEVIQQQARELETELEVRISDADWARFQTQRR